VILRINGVSIPAPTKFAPLKADLDSENTLRADDGYMRRDRIRQGVGSFTAEWMLAPAEYAALSNLLNPAKISVEVFDVSTNSTKTMEMYAGQRDSECVSYPSKSRPQDSLWKLTVPFTQY